MSSSHFLFALIMGCGAAAMGVVVALFASNFIRKSVPAELMEPPGIKVELAKGHEVTLDHAAIRCMVEDLLHTSHPEIHVIPTGAEGEMAYRGEIWDSLAEVRTRYLRLTPLDPPIVGVHLVPFWLTNASTADEAWDACEEYLEDQVRLAVEGKR